MSETLLDLAFDIVLFLAAVAVGYLIATLEQRWKRKSDG
jgi:hypothetical protein